jgi:RNA polymerase sigma-70 factor, ECF subfamily
LGRSSWQTSGDQVKGMNSVVQCRNETELIAAIVAGDIHLYDQLIRPYERSVYSVSFSYMKNEEDAADVAQETFIKAFRNLWAFRGDAKFSTWLVSIALNEARNRLRRQATIRTVSLDEPQGENGPVSTALLRDWRELPSEAVEREQISRLLRRAIEMLPNTYRQVFLLRDVEESTINDTAKILDISTSLVKVRLHRARRMLRRLLEPKLKAISTVSRKMQFQ